jgi:hypothetical protein
LPASYVLHGVFLCATSLTLFYGLYALLGRVALAGVIATALGFYTHAHGSGGWDYHNTAAGAFYLVAFMLLALPAATAGGRTVLALAGGAVALAIHCNITLVNFIPALALVHVQALRSRHPPPRFVYALGVRGGWTLLGAVVVTVVLGVINLMAGRELLFFSVLVNITARYVSDSNYVATWRHNWSDGWILTAKHLALPAAVFLAGVLALVVQRMRRRPLDAITSSLVLQFLGMAVVWVGWQAAGQLALDWDYFAYVLIPPCFIALGGLLSVAWPETFERAWLATILGTIAACAVCLSGAIDTIAQSLTTSALGVIAVAGCAVFASGLLAYVFSPRLSTSILVIAVFAFGNRFVADHPDDYSARDGCQLQPQIYNAIVDGASFLGRLDPTYTRAQSWFEQDEKIEPIDGCPVGVGLMAGAMTTMAYVPYVTRPWPMPAVEGVPEEAVRAVASKDDVLAIISNHPENLDAWSRRLDHMGLEHRELARHRVPLLSSGFTIHAWELLPKPPQGVSFGPPVLTVTPQTPAQTLLYGSPKGTLTIEGGMTVFRPTDDADHVAYPFVALAVPTEIWAQLDVELPPSVVNPPSCALTVQNAALTNVASFPCGTGKRYLKVPANTSSLRVYLTDPKIRSFVLPRRIELSLAESGR